MIEGVFPRRNFSSSRLVRLLGEAALVEVDASRQDSAERLSLWLNAFDAIKLHAAQQSIGAVAQARPSQARAAGASAVEEEFHRVRTALEKAIAANGPSPAHGKQAKPAHLHAEAVVEADADYAPYRQRYQDQQRQMELRIGPLRDFVRQALSKASPGLRQLAALDAAWEELLGAREQRLLATVPALLERRFEHLRKTRQPGVWLEAFGRELQAVLLAELELRLQPVAGLVEALSNEIKK